MQAALRILRLCTGALAFTLILARGAPLTVFGEAYPPFLLAERGQLSGPYVEAFSTLLRPLRLDIRYVELPVKRAMQDLARHPDSCILAAPFSPGEAETMSYVGRLAPITISVYALRGQSGRIRNIEDLRGHRLGAIDIAEVRDLLGTAGIAYQPLPLSNNGVQMLAARRFDLLVSDVQPELMNAVEQKAVQRAFTLARVERWLACRPDLPPATLAALRSTLREGLFAESLRPVWVKHGLEGYFDAIRRQWDAVSKGGAKPASSPLNRK